MSPLADVRCANCGHLVAASSVWAINGFCSKCLQPLDTAGGRRAGGSVREIGAKDVVSQWFTAFNARELDVMLACMHPRVDFYPLRLHGLDGSYHGHDGVRSWFAGLEEMQHRHRVELSEVRDGRGDQLVVIGSLSAVDPAGPASFWALERVVGGMIVSAHHYLTDPIAGFDYL